MDKVQVLSSSPLFDMLADQELTHVAGLAVPRHFSAGQAIFEEGELGESVYVIVAGEVEVLHKEDGGGARVLAELRAPEFFGEMCLVDKIYRSATVRARTDADLLQISSEELANFRKQYPDGYTLIVLNIARVLSARLREANARLGPLPGKGIL